MCMCVHVCVGVWYVCCVWVYMCMYMWCVWLRASGEDPCGAGAALNPHSGASEKHRALSVCGLLT